MHRQESRTPLTILLVVLLLLAPVTTVLAWLDATRWHYVLIPPGAASPTDTPSDNIPIQPENLQRLKQSILNIRVPNCDGTGLSSGTAFVVAPGYVATAAHVVKDHQACSSEMVLVDYRGLEYPAELAGYSDETQLDLALLSFGDQDLASLPLSNSSLFEQAAGAVEVITIGYPPGASTVDESAISGAGLISSFRDGVFFTSGMDLNPGNSGGPVFIMTDWTVLGVASKKGDAAQGGEGLGLVVPSSVLAQFYEDRIGRPL
ncbi:MAG: serine protease [Acidobacteriota bacterium]|nr:serine protease [Acidobacteriota bacterium]